MLTQARSPWSRIERLTRPSQGRAAPGLRALSLLMIIAMLINSLVDLLPRPTVRPGDTDARPAPALDQMRNQGHPIAEPVGISKLAAFDNGDGRALISWRADRPYRYQLRYGPTPALGASADPAAIASERLPSGGVQHTLRLALPPGQPTYYRIDAFGPDGAPAARSFGGPIAVSGGPQPPFSPNQPRPGGRPGEGPVGITSATGAIISNGTVEMGVFDTAELNYGGRGLKYIPTGGDAIIPGCACEGWGAADALGGVTGYANQSTDGGAHNMTVESFVASTTTATSTVNILNTMRVTHVYKPAAVSNYLYQVDVAITNIAASAIDLRYRRVMDWDVPPTEFNEYITNKGTSSPYIVYASDDGFATGNPLGGPSSIDFVGDATDSGPDDHGALFDFTLGYVQPGFTKRFTIYYGAAGNESTALSTLQAASAQIYSLGEQSGDPGGGTPNTFMFGFDFCAATLDSPLGASGATVFGREPADSRLVSNEWMVRMNDGDLVQSIPLLRLRGKGLPINFELTHAHRLMEQTQSLSYGWTHSYSRRLCVNKSVATLFTEDGDQIRYTVAGSSFTPPTGAIATLAQDSASTPCRYVLTYRDGSKDCYSVEGQLTSVRDALGNQTQLTYANGVLSTITNATTGQKLNLTYTVLNNRLKLTSVADDAANGGTIRSVSLSYDTDGRLSSVADPAGFKTSFTYDSKGRLLRYYDANNDPASPGALSLLMAYDAQGRVSSQTLPNGVTCTYNWSAGGAGYDTEMSCNDATGTAPRLTRFQHDASRFLTRVYNTVSDGSLAPYAALSYNANGQVTSYTDPLGKTWSYDVELATGDVRNITDPLGNITSAQYNGAGQATQANDPAGGVVRTSYDTSGTLPTRQSDPVGRALSTTYNSVGQPTAQVQPNGVTNVFSYDALGFGSGGTGDVTPIGGSETLLSQGKPASASSSAAGQGAARANDGDSASAWTASAATFPQTWEVDFGQNYRATRFVADWANNSATYQYKVEVKVDGGSTYTLALDQTANSTPGDADRTFASAQTARYVRVTVTAVSSGAAAANELQVFGTSGGFTGGLTTPTYLATATGGSTNSANGWPTQTVSQQCTVTSYSGYNANGWAAEQALDPSGRNIRQQPTYDKLGQITKWDQNVGATNANERATQTIAYDGMNWPTQVTDPASQITRAAYTPYGELSKVTDPLNRDTTTSYSYGASGLVTTRTDSNGKTLRQEYDAAGRLTKTTDARGTVTTYAYYDTGWLRSQSVSYSATYGAARTDTTSYTYDALGRVRTITDPLGNVTNYTRNSAGEVTDITYPEGNVLHYDYDELGRVRREVKGSGSVNQTTEYRYDALGRLRQQIADPSGLRLTTTYAYTLNCGTGQITTAVTDPRGKTTTYVYDKMGWITQVTDALGGVWRFEYDGLGRLTRKTDALGRVTTATYDARGLKLGETNPLGRSASWSYNADGTLASMTDFAGQLISYSYDVLQRLTGINYNDAGATGNVTLAYDNNGNVTSMTDKLGTVTYSYDAYDRLDGRTRDGRLVKYTRGWDGRVLSVTWNNQVTTSFGYDRNGRITSLAFPGTTLTSTYDAANQRTQVNNGASIFEQLSYDGAGRVTQLSYPNSGSAATTFSYLLDANGNRTRMTDIEGVTNYTYDDLNRLTQASYPAVASPAIPARTVSYSYDAVGNRLSQALTQSGTTTTTNYCYDADDRLTASAVGQPCAPVGAGVTSYSYDNNGNMLSGPGGQSYSWDRANRLTRVTQSSGVISSYGYDGRGNRVRKTITGGSYGTTGLTIQSDLDESQALPYVLAEVGSNGKTNIYAKIAVATIQGGTVVNLLRSDALGSVRELQLLGTGSGSARQSFDAWGQARVKTGTWPTTLGYAGELGEEEGSGLIYLRARTYDPRTGRFTARDTFPGAPQAPQSLNRYAYTENNPATRTDPSGNCAWLGLALADGPEPGPADLAALALCLATLASGSAAIRSGSSSSRRTEPQPEPSPSPRPVPVRPDDDDNDWVYFIHGTTSRLWGNSTTIRGGGNGELGRGFYAFADDNWGRESAANWARRKAKDDGSTPLLIRVGMPRSTYERLRRIDYGADDLDDVYRALFPNGLASDYFGTPVELISGPTGVNGDGRRVPNYRLPNQYKFEGTGVGKLIFLQRIELSR